MSEDPGAADTSTHERAAEDAERESERPKRPSVTEEASAAAGKDMRRFEEGPKVVFLGGPLPVRALVALVIFVTAFTAVLLLLWMLVGTLGLVLGWIVAAVVGYLAARLAADRVG